jgi:exopolysaccharide biosynthesis polyprenyl glycosylphosphotransferase
MIDKTLSLGQNKKTFALYVRYGKYAFDAVCALFLLMILAPLFLIVALLIKLESKGPVFFMQNRVGKNGEIFKIFKFRSMTTMDNGDNVVQATKNDMRITKIGKFIRKTSIDELPQLINVVLGDMSLVGPRPHAVAHDREFAQKQPQYVLRQNVLPGITGYAQVKGFRGETDTDEKLLGRIKYDVKYVNKISFFLDMKILLKTVWIVLFPKNAY